MKTALTVAAARKIRAGFKGRTVLVPTMGALHSGHAALIRTARKSAGAKGAVVVSIFVNPLQFGPGEDFERYPRVAKDDAALCAKLGVDLLFRPAAGAMIPDGPTTWVDETRLSTTLCGQCRPGHFRGVCTIVAKLFNILAPDVAVFGEKDWQQLAVVRRMVRDLDFPTKIRGVKTVREPGGLAMSSRNRFLNAEQREAAMAFPAALKRAAALKSAGAIQRTAERLLSIIPGAHTDYVELVEASSLTRATDLRRPARLVAAVYFGETRLIDNVPVQSQPRPDRSSQTSSQ